MNHTASWWTNGGMFVLACLLFVALVRFAFQQWVMEAARDWRRDRDADQLAAQYADSAPPAPWDDHFTVKPWYVRRAERWEARRGPRGSR